MSLATKLPKNYSNLARITKL